MRASNLVLAAGILVTGGAALVLAFDGEPALGAVFLGVALCVAGLGWQLREQYLHTLEMQRSHHELDRQLSGPLARVDARVRRVHRRLDRLNRDLRTRDHGVVSRSGKVIDQLTARFERVDKQFERMVGQHTKTRDQVEMSTADAILLARLLDEIAPGMTPIPTFGGWALTARTALALVEEVVRRDGPVNVVECGSGTSTVLLALLLRHRGQGGHVLSLEHDADFAEETRQRLVRHGVQDLATVVTAAVKEQSIDERPPRVWYDRSAIPETADVDILMVDGPIGKMATEARWPAFPVFARTLVDGATVILDDTDRPHEQAIVQDWTSRPRQGRSLSTHRVLGRATLMQVDTTD